MKIKSLKKFLVMLFLAALIPSSAEEVDSGTIIYKGMASWYSCLDPGILPTTANMEKFDDTAATCAMWDLPFGTILKVTNVDNGNFVLVRVNDRGPAKRFVHEGRIVDLTKAAFSEIADLDKGLIPVSIEIVSIPS